MRSLKEHHSNHKQWKKGNSAGHMMFLLVAIFILMNTNHFNVVAKISVVSYHVIIVTGLMTSNQTHPQVILTWAFQIFRC